MADELDTEWEGELTAEERGMIDAAWEQHKAAEPCTIPPPGWWCRRGKGHDGPCAARATTDATTITRIAEANAAQAREIEGLVAAGNELSDKLWVLRCNSRDDKDREAAEKAYDMWTEARRPRALTGGPHG